MRASVSLLIFRWILSTIILMFAPLFYELEVS